MRVVVAHGPNADVRERRQILHAAGVDCDGADCVSWLDLPIRLGQRDADLVLLFVDDDGDVPWEAIQDSAQLTTFPFFSVGSNADNQRRASEAGAIRHIDEGNLRTEVDGIAERYRAMRGGKERGVLISVIAPLVGSGGSTISANLAGALAKKAQSQQVALVEFTPHGGELATMLNVTPEHTVTEACKRYESLDPMRLRNIAMEHSSGLKLLLEHPDSLDNEHLCADAIRRLAILCRVAFDYTVLAIDSRLDDGLLMALRASDTIVVVTRPDILSLRRAKLALQWAKDRGLDEDRLRVVVNRWGQSGQLSAKQIESSLGVKVQDWIPDDPKRVNLSINQGVLIRELSSTASITRRFNSLATRLNGKLSG